MIITEYGSQKAVCDSCDVTEHVIDGDFNAIISEMKEDGWRITRPDGQQRHECSQCVNDASPLTRARKMFGIR